MSEKKEKRSWYQRFNFVKNTKDALLRRVAIIFGSLIFIYILAKSIPNSIKKYKLKKHELELEAKKLEVEKLRLQIEAEKLKQISTK